MGLCQYKAQSGRPAKPEASQETMGKKKVLVEGRTKQERIEQRKKLGTLQSLTVQPATKKRYDIALNRFLDFLKDEGIAIPTK